MNDRERHRTKQLAEQTHVAYLVEEMSLLVGSKLVARAIKASSAGIIRQYAQGYKMDSETESSLRQFYIVILLLVAHDGPGSAYHWLISSNNHFDGAAPVDSFAQGQEEAVLYEAAQV